MYDKHEQIAHDAKFTVSILGNPATSDFELIAVPSPKFTEEQLASHRARGLYYVGIAGLVDGVPRTALDEPLDPTTISLLAQAYLRHVEAAMNAAQEAECLQRMYGLPDERAN